VKPLRPDVSSEVPVRPEEAGIRLLVERVRVVAWATDRELRVTWGLKSPALSGLETRLGRLLGSTDPHLPAVAAHRRALGGEAAEFEMEWRGRTLCVRVEPLRGEGAVTGTVAVAVEERKVVPALRAGKAPTEAAPLVPAAETTDDALTGLPGRAVFLARLRRSTGPRWCAEGLFVLLFDLDRFREINDRLGFAGGDQLLAEVSVRLKRRLRAADTIARFGADEFAVLLFGVPSGEEAARIADRLLGELSSPFEVLGRWLNVRATAGIAVGVAGARPEDLVREAERALGRARMRVRSDRRTAPAGDGEETSLLQVETALRQALDQDEIRARYRPTVLRKDGKVPGFEVVLWRRPPMEGESADGGGVRRAG
jgi:diguanylate cyclase (GGDEF)-like protein